MTRRGLLTPLFGVLFGGAACAPLRLTTPGEGARAAGTRLGLSYGEDPRQTLEVHAPPRAQARPVMLLFHGGDRQGPDRLLARDAARVLAARGWVTFLADLRAGPGTGSRTGLGSGQAFIADAAAATVWAADHAADFGGDPTRLGVLGLGAGAEAALMIALDRRYLAARGRSGLIRAAASWRRSEPGRDLTLTRPEAYVRADAPPIWLSGGGDADTVLSVRIRAVGGRVELDASRKASLDGTAEFLLRTV